MLPSQFSSNTTVLMNCSGVGDHFVDCSKQSVDLIEEGATFFFTISQHSAAEVCETRVCETSAREESTS